MKLANHSPLFNMPCLNQLFLMLALALISPFLMVAQSTKQAGTITIQNKSSLILTNKLVSIPWQTVKNSFPSIDTAGFIVVDATTKKQLVYQLEYAGQAAIQQLLVQTTLRPGVPVKLLIQKGKRPTFTAKTYGRFVPERKEDFAWENDKIAFRMYGKELEKTPKENAYGIDVWVKRTDKMIINDRYKRAEYHIDHGDGLDYYHVGLTLGAGNIMPYVNDTIWYSANYTSWKILDNGPLRTTFQLGYDSWNVAGKKLSATKTISLDAGSQLNKVTVDYAGSDYENLPVVVGIIKRPEPGIQWLDEQKGILAYWEPPHGKDGTTGVGCIIPAVSSMSVNKGQLMAFSSTLKDKPFIYYTGAAWDKAGLITNMQQWQAYLQKAAEALKAEITIR